MYLPGDQIFYKSCIYNLDVYFYSMADINVCVAGQMRLLARVVTSLYNDAFVGERVTFAQASLLMFIFAQPGVRQITLSQQLQIKKSALSRDVQLLQRNGWLTDNIRQGLYLTEAGQLLAKRCHKIWKVLNTRVREQLGEEVLAGLSTVSDAIRQLPQLSSNASL